MLTRFIRFLSLLPLMTAFSFAALVCVARYYLGHWSVVYVDDLSSNCALWYENMYDWFTTSLAVTLLSAPIWLILVYYQWQWANNLKIAKVNLLLFALGWAAMVCIVRFDPGRYFEWFLD